MQTIHHYIHPVGAKGRTLDASGRPAAQASSFTLGLRSELFVHFRPDGCASDSDPEGLDGVAPWRFTLAVDWNPATPPCFLATDATHVGPGLFRVDVSDTRTCEMVIALGNKRSAPVTCELSGIAADGTWASPEFLCQWPASIDNRVDSGTGPTPFPPDPISGDAIARIEAALASVSSTTPLTASETADRITAVIIALKNL